MEKQISARDRSRALTVKLRMPDQRSLVDQLTDLRNTATVELMYDAADYLTTIIEKHK